MYAERRLAFEKRVGELLSDHLKAVGPLAFHGPQMLRAKKAFFNDLTPRILSALEDSFQMGRRDMGNVGVTEAPEATWVAPPAPAEVPKTEHLVPAFPNNKTMSGWEPCFAPCCGPDWLHRERANG